MVCIEKTFLKTAIVVVQIDRVLVCELDTSSDKVTTRQGRDDSFDDTIMQ